MNIYALYWIHLSSHSDISCEGYIGITNRPEIRFQEHLRESTKQFGSRNVLYEKLRTYENVSYSILCYGDKEYIRQLEITLRPKWQIGWNYSPGGYSGGATPGRKTGWKQTKESNNKRKVSLSGKRNGMFGKQQSDYQKSKAGGKGKFKPGTSKYLKNKFEENPESNPFFGKAESKSPVASKLIIDDEICFACWDHALEYYDTSLHLLRINHKCMKWVKKTNTFIDVGIKRDESKKMMFINNGIHQTKIWNYEEIPVGYVRGALSKKRK